MPPGAKFGGRKKGSKNKFTMTAKKAFEFAFDKIGGAEHLAGWAAENPNDFYKLFSKLLPLESFTEHSGQVSLGELITKSYKIERGESDEGDQD